MVKILVPTEFHNLPGILSGIVLLYCLKILVSGAIFYCFLFLSIHVHPVYGLMCQQPDLKIPVWFRCSCFSALSYSFVDMIILLPFIAVPSMIAISSLNDHYQCRPAFTSALVDGQPCSMNSDSMHMCSSSDLAILITFTVTQSGMSMYDCSNDGDTHAWDFSIYTCLVVVSG